MSYQPIQLGRLGINAGMDSVENALSQAIRSYQENQRMAAENLRYAGQQKRQGLMDRQSAMAEASKLWAAGDKEGAKAIMAPYGAKMESYEVDAPKDWAPKLNQGEIDFADTLPMDRPGAPQGPQMPGQQQPPPGPVDAISSPTTGAPEGIEALMQRAAPMGDQQATHPLVAAAQAQAKQQKLMAQRLRGKFDDGTEWMMDPDAGRRDQQAKTDQAFYQASGDEGPMADIIREQYPGMRAASSAAGKPLDADDTMKVFKGEATLRRQAEADAARQAHQDAMQQQQWAMAVMRDNRSDENNRRMAMAILGSAKMRGGAAEDASNRGWNTQGEGLFKNYTGSQGYAKQVESTRGYQNMLEDLKSGNTALMMGGLGAWVKEKSGGSAVVTENEIKRYLTSSMPWSQELDRQFNYWVKGDPQLSQDYVKPFTDALEKTVVARQRAIIDHIGKGAQATFMADENPEIRAQADAAYTRAITPLMSPEQLDEFIRQRKEQTAPQAAPGSKPGKTSAPRDVPMTTPKAGPSPKGPQFQLTPADHAMANKAKAVQPGDPLYDSAQKWLKAHGL